MQGEPSLSVPQEYLFLYLSHAPLGKVREGRKKSSRKPLLLCITWIYSFVRVTLHTQLEPGLQTLDPSDNGGTVPWPTGLAAADAIKPTI